MLSDNVVFTKGAAAHLPDKPLIAFYDTHGRKGGDGMIFYSAATTRPTSARLMAIGSSGSSSFKEGEMRVYSSARATEPVQTRYRVPGKDN